MVKGSPMAVDRTGKPDQAPPLPALLALLGAGEIDTETYIERKLEAATAHLRGLTAAELQRVRALLRAQIAEEPELRELVSRATGVTRG
jgi:hypothetical protein